MPPKVVIKVVATKVVVALTPKVAIEVKVKVGAATKVKVAKLKVNGKAAVAAAKREYPRVNAEVEEEAKARAVSALAKVGAYQANSSEALQRRVAFGKTQRQSFFQVPYHPCRRFRST